MKIKKVIKNSVRIIAFVTLFCILLSYVTNVMFRGVDSLSYNSMKGFYEEEENTLDAVYIGSSNVLAFWNPLFAWEEYGIAVSSFGTNSQPLAAAEYLIREAQKTQEDALMIVNINTLGITTNITRLHRVFTYSPPSYNKYSYINEMADLYDLSAEEQFELYFPITRFHTRWEELKDKDYTLETDGFKGAITYTPYLNTSVDISDEYIYSDGQKTLPFVIHKTVTNLLDYCDEEEVNVLFVTVPQGKAEETLMFYNKINSMIEARGYTVLDLMDKTEEIHLYTHKDYYNTDHINIHGSLKFTYYMSEYLIENYGFEDKRDNEEYASWDEGLDEYKLRIDSSILPFQMDSDYNPNIISAVSNLSAMSSEGSILINWVPSNPIFSYEVYRRVDKGGAWHLVADTSEHSYTDTNIVEGTDYYYRVVPYYKTDDVKQYGDFSYEGVHTIAR